ncbi:MAG: tetratricopeptide repeat protein [Chloroflexi bacterium]|nr:tetratricopeptide repeat protein [Chloroflexota bacterium]
MDREGFREKLQEFRRLTGRTQIELADALGIAEKVLSRKLNGKANAILTHFEIKQIVRTLAEWHAITTQREAHALLKLLDLSPAFFSPAEWAASPLDRLDSLYEEQQYAENSIETLNLPRLSNLISDEQTTQKEEAQPPDQLKGPPPQYPTNLPVFPTPLVGREQSIGQVCNLLERSDVQLVTLVGPGGIGKTRLSVQVAARLAGHFPHGVWFVSLASLRDSSLVLPSLAQALALHNDIKGPVEEGLAAYLRNKQILLILDNFEQVIAAAPALGRVLASSPGLKMLVTSRITLRLYGEYEYNVPLLALPDLNSPLSIETLADNSAIQLFVQRAQSIKADFEITPQNALSVAQICTRLDGLPLAIELAATRIRLFSPKLLLARLEHRLPMLTGGSSNLPERHQTVRATIQWSYTLLEEAEKALFARLSVFAGGGTLAAIEAICGSERLAYVDILTGLESLMSKSLLYSIDDPEGEVRFFMLETIREFAQERLAESVESPAISQLHAEYYVALAEKLAPLLSTARLTDTLERLTQELDNLRSACGWSISQVVAEAALRIAGCLQLFWYWRGHVDEGRRWLETALGRSQGASAAVCAKAYRCAGLLAWAQGDYVQALVYDKQSFTLYQALGDNRGMAEALNSLGNSSSEMGDDPTARRFYEQSLEFYRAAAYNPGIAMVLSNLGELAARTSDYPAARAYFEESLTLKRMLGNPGSIALVLLNLGEVALVQGDNEQAVDFLEEGLRLGRSVNTPHIIGLCLENLAKVALRRGAIEDALKLLRESLSLLRHIHNIRALLYTLECTAGAFAFGGQTNGAVRLFGAAEALRESLGVPLATGDRSIYEWLRSGVSLGEETQMWATEWAMGRAMTLEEAIDFALNFDPTFAAGQAVTG